MTEEQKLMAQLEDRLKETEAVVLKQHEQIQNLLEAVTGLAKLTATLREAQQGHQRIFASLHAALVQKGLISSTEPPESAVN
jgi:hypothetical protein